jgi:hypothetical protein
MASRTETGVTPNKKKGDLNGANSDFNQAVKLGLKSGGGAEAPD